MANDSGSWAEVAKAYVTIIPNMKGAAAKIKDDVGDAVEAGVEQGSSNGAAIFGDNLTRTLAGIGLGSLLAEPIAAAMKEVGTESGQNIGSGILGALDSARRLRSGIIGELVAAGGLGSIKFKDVLLAGAKITARSFGNILNSDIAKTFVNTSKNSAKLLGNFALGAVKKINFGSAITTNFNSGFAQAYRTVSTFFNSKILQPIKSSKYGQLVSNMLSGAMATGASTGSNSMINKLLFAANKYVPKMASVFAGSVNKIGSLFSRMFKNSSSDGEKTFGKGLTDAFKKIGSKASENLKSVFDKTFKKSGESGTKSITKAMESAGQSGGEKLSNGISTSIGKIAIGNILAMGIIGAAGAITNAIHSVFSGAFQSFAVNEQLVDGVKTIFKDASDEVYKNADAAFSTAGLSANEYMETVTSFSASLISSLGGDTAEAARLANTAIVDMSDNSNKMGTNIRSIQDAYQGFAKQNYTMLD